MESQQILSSLPDYPYELFFDDTEDESVACLVPNCGRKFGTYEEYLSHYLYNNGHTSYIKRNLMKYNPREGLGEELVWDPLEKLQIEHNIKTDPDYIALKYNRDATQHLIDKIKFAVKNNRNIIAISIGVPGAGKSYATYALAMYTSGQFAEALGKRTKVDLEFTQADFLETVTKTIDCEGDSLIQDEDPRGFGSGQKTNVAAFENLGKTARKKNLNIFVVSPIEPDIKNIGFIVEFFAFYPKPRIAKGILYTRKKLALGYVYIEILPPEDYIIYEERKDAFLDNMIATGGFGIENYSDERIDRDFKALRETVIMIDPNMTKTRILSKAYRYARGDTKYQAMIAEDVFYDLKENPVIGTQESKKKPVRVSKQGVAYEWQHIKTERDIGILEDLYQFAKDMDFKPFAGKNVSVDDLERGLEAWRLKYIEELSDLDSTRELNKLFKPAMDRKMYFRKGDGKIKKFVGGPMGTAGELVAQKWFYPDHTHVGGTGAPDLISPADTIVEVKTKDKKEKKSMENLVSEDRYFRDYVARKVPIKGVIINYDDGAVFVDFYDLVYIDGGIEDGI